MIIEQRLQQDLDQLGSLIQLRNLLVGQLKSVNDSIGVSIKDVVEQPWRNRVGEEEELIEF